MAWCAVFAGWLAFATAVCGATLKAEYRFDSSLASSVPGAPDLAPIDPMNLNGFTNDVVNGQTQTVYSWSGTASPVSQQAGFKLTTSGLVSSTNYSVAMRFKLTDRNLAWRRLIDVNNRQSDNGFYVDPNNHLAVYPIISSVTPFITGAYADVVLTVGGGVVTAYLNGTQQFSGNSRLMDITNPTNSLIFFVDNNVGGGQGEYSNGSIAWLRLYDGGNFEPTLSISTTATNSVVLSWPSPSPGFILQQTPELSPTNWTAAATTPTDNGIIKSVVVPTPAGQMFYRLYHP